MKKRAGLWMLVVASGLALAGGPTWANNLTLTNVTFTNTLKKAGTTDIRFDLSWSNSWRAAWVETNTGYGNITVTNWDAAWVFIKYRLRTGADTNWQHARLAADGHWTPEGVTATPGATDGTNVGAFVYRSTNGYGPLTIPGLRLRWAYAAQGLSVTNPLDVSVHAIEMVYIPEGSFYLGDDVSSDVKGQFEAGTSGTPFLITNDSYEIILGGGGDGSLGNHNCSGQNARDDFSNNVMRTLPAAFPKGYNAFYCMKYEITQEQYKNFLNSLTRAQQTNLVASAGTNASYFAMAGTSVISNRNGIRCPASVLDETIRFGCDFNTNGVFNEVGDGQDLACGFLRGADGAAYADWAGLRPMTEMEFEKACRGPNISVAGEYAWGTASSTSFTNYPIGTMDGCGTETALPTNANCIGNRYDSTKWIQGPLRAGIFAKSSSTRQLAGAGYYGVMELSGNLWEYAVAVGISAGRSFTGAHGDGALTTNGWANVSAWPANTGPSTGWGQRGGSGSGVMYLLRISDRYNAVITVPVGRDWKYGFRGVRAAP